MIFDCSVSFRFRYYILLLCVVAIILHRASITGAYTVHLYASVVNSLCGIKKRHNLMRYAKRKLKKYVPSYLL